MQKALENAKMAVEIDSNYAPNQMVLATSQLTMKDRESLATFRKAMKLIRSGPVYEGFYLGHHIFGNLSSSAIYGVSADKFPRNSNSLSLYGYTMLYLKDYQKAIEEFNKAIGANPDYHLPYKGLGETFMQLGQKENAAIYFKKAMELNDLDTESKALLDQLNDTT